VQQLLKQADRTIQYAANEQYDLVYCAGLFDYLQDKVCRKLMTIFYEMLAPGGLLLVTNVDVHPSRAEMECFLEWHLIHRNTQRMAELVPAGIPRDDMVIKRDSTGVNLFLELRRPQHV
jgi:extracellular factor (EF) 3-hydroxypalmitic acid methyl ester biosynthesis protein